MNHDDALVLMKDCLREWGYPADDHNTRIHYCLSFDDPERDPYVSLQFGCFSERHLSRLFSRVYTNRGQGSAYARLHRARQERGLLSLLSLFEQDGNSSWELGVTVLHGEGQARGHHRASLTGMEVAANNTKASIEVLASKAYRSAGLELPDKARHLGSIWGRFLIDLEHELQATSAALLNAVEQSLRASGKSSVTDKSTTPANKAA